MLLAPTALSPLPSPRPTPAGRTSAADPHEFLKSPIVFVVGQVPIPVFQDDRVLLWLGEPVFIYLLSTYLTSVWIWLFVVGSAFLRIGHRLGLGIRGLGRIICRPRFGRVCDSNPLAAWTVPRQSMEHSALSAWTKQIGEQPNRASDKLSFATIQTEIHAQLRYLICQRFLK